MAEVLNGTVQTGDRVAYATREGNVPAIHLGVVIEIVEKPHPWREGVTSTTLRIKVDTETNASWHDQSRSRLVGSLDRVVKV
jgi:hypothetical protein